MSWTLSSSGAPFMSRNSLYLVIALLAALAVGFGIYTIYQENQKPGLEIKFDDNGVKINGNG
jgi:uncharacterized protein HemX